MHKSQKRKTRRVYRNESKQPSPNWRTRSWKWLLLCSLCSHSKCQSSSTKSSFVHHWPHCEPLPAAAQTLEDQYCEEPESQDFFVIVLHRFGTEIYIFLQGNWKSIAIKPIYPLQRQQFNILRLFLIQIFRTKMIILLTLKAKMMIVIHYFRTLQRPLSSQKISLERFLTVQSSTGRLKCATTPNFVFVHVQVIPDHGGEKVRSSFMMIMNAR